MQLVSNDITPVGPMLSASSFLRPAIGFVGSTVALTSLLVFLSAL